MEYQTIKFDEPQPGLGLLTFNRPERLNAISLEMLDDLYHLFDALDRNDAIRVLIITGAGRGFCSGADLKDKRLLNEEGLKLFSSAALHLEHVQKRYAGIILKMRRLAQPTIAAVNGPAAGGGMCLALASDIVIASRTANFVASFINIGLSAGEFGTTYFLPKLVGVARASEILMTGRTVSAEEADKIGLVSCLVEEDRLMEKAMETARIMLTKSPFGLRMTREAIHRNLNAPSLEAAVEFENRNQSMGCCDPDFFNAVMAFMKTSDE
jgi:enoyl-CoA hydratase